QCASSGPASSDAGAAAAASLGALERVLDRINRLRSSPRRRGPRITDACLESLGPRLRGDERGGSASVQIRRTLGAASLGALLSLAAAVLAPGPAQAAR